MRRMLRPEGAVQRVIKKRESFWNLLRFGGDLPANPNNILGLRTEVRFIPDGGQTVTSRWTSEEPSFSKPVMIRDVLKEARILGTPANSDTITPGMVEVRIGINRKRFNRDKNGKIELADET